MTLGDAAPAPTASPFEMTHGSHVLPGLSKDDSEQLKKMVRGDAQLALSHVGFHDPHDAAGLTLDEAHQVPASKVAGHEKFEICHQRSSQTGQDGRAKVHRTAPLTSAAFLVVVAKLAAGRSRNARMLEPEEGPHLKVAFRAAAHGDGLDGSHRFFSSPFFFLLLLFFVNGDVGLPRFSPEPESGQQKVDVFSLPAVSFVLHDGCGQATCCVLSERQGFRGYLAL
jgi:hypothetical protein